MVTKLSNVVSAMVPKIPDGSYEGTWSGYRVCFTVGDENYMADSSDGVRGINVPCVVTIRNGEATVCPK